MSKTYRSSQAKQLLETIEDLQQFDNDDPESEELLWEELTGMDGDEGMPDVKFLETELMKQKQRFLDQIKYNQELLLRKLSESVA